MLSRYQRADGPWICNTPLHIAELSESFEAETRNVYSICPRGYASNVLGYRALQQYNFVLSDVPDMLAMPRQKILNPDPINIQPARFGASVLLRASH